MEELNDFERRVLTAACGADPEAPSAMEQLAVARVSKRDCTGQGGFVHLRVQGDFDEIPANGRMLKGAEGMMLRHPKLEHGADVIVWLKEGLLDCLEYYAFGEDDWPDDLEAFVVERTRREQPS